MAVTESRLLLLSQAEAISFGVNTDSLSKLETRPTRPGALSPIAPVGPIATCWSRDPKRTYKKRLQLKSCYS